MKIVKVPVKVSVLTENEIEKYEELGMEIPNEANDGEIFINVESIAAFFPFEDSIDLELVSGRRISVYMDVEDFINLIQDDN